MTYLRGYNLKLKDLIKKDFQEGIGVMALSRKHNVPKSTLQGWLKLYEHSHTWVIASPNGPTSKGECTICKEVRDFRNSLETHTWMGTPVDKKA